MVRAHLYETGLKWDNARVVLEKANAADPASPAAGNNLAALYLDLEDDITRALSLAQETKLALPDSPAAGADNFGWALYKRSYDLAIPQLTEAIKKVPSNAQVQYHLGMAYLAVNRLEPAAQPLRGPLSGNPGFADAGNPNAALDSMAKRARK